MAFKRLTITFSAEFVDTDTLTFELYDTVLASGTTYTYTWVSLNRSKDEVLVAIPFGVTGEGTAINYQNAIEIDYGVSDWTITRSANSVILTTTSEDTEFRNISASNQFSFSIKDYTPPVTPTKNGYYFEFTDVENILHRVNIYDPTSTPEYVQVEGNCTLESQDDEDTMTSLRPQMLNVNLLSNTSLTFEDLYTEQERVYKVEYIRNSVTEFIGWLSPEGLYENYVEDKWYINLQAIDGLGYLKDLAYTDSDGFNYVGKQSFINVISNCLVKTSLDLGIRASIGLKYDGLVSDEILANAFVNAERYLTNNNSEALSCEEVLKSCLELFNATLLQNGGYWYIYRPIEAHDSANITFYNYDKDGVLISGTETIAKDISFSLGSQIDSYYPHHANGNQQKSIKRSLGVYRLNLKYGNVFPYYDNQDLIWSSSSTIDDWTITGGGEITQAYTNRGFLIYKPDGNLDVQARSDDYLVGGSSKIDISFTFTNPFPQFFSAPYVELAFKLGYYKGANYYYSNQQGAWVSGTSDPETSGDLILQKAEPNTTDNVFRLITNVVPEEDGTLFICVFNPGNAGPIIITRISAQTYIGEDAPQGLNYTIQKSSNFTPSSDEVKKVLNGDIEDGTYYSTIYENDQTTPTNLWTDGVNLKQLLRYMVEDRVKMAWTPRIMFEGDVFGFVPLFSVININNVKEKMLPVNWVYDAKNNITTIKSIELQNTEITDSDVLFSVTEDYGETVKPTIKS